MHLTKEEEQMLSGEQGTAVRKSMEILVALGDIYGAEKLVSVKSVQIAGVSYSNLGDAGLEYLANMALDGKAKVLTTLNPAGMDLENYKNLGISEDFAVKQRQVIDAFTKMGVIPTCTCTPYFVGNKPDFGDHIAWSESSAVAYANSVIGAKTNREGGPSALAASLTGKTPLYGFHLEENRQAEFIIDVPFEIKTITQFGALGKIIGNKIQNAVPLIQGIKKENAGTDELKSFGASIATYGGTALYHMQRITPNKTIIPEEKIVLDEKEFKEIYDSMNDACEADLISIGCPHCSLDELKELANLLKGKEVKKEMWVCVARPVKKKADELGYSKIIEESGAKFACDTCMVVAPIKGRFKCMVTNSGKAVYYARAKNKFKTDRTGVGTKSSSPDFYTE